MNLTTFGTNKTIKNNLYSLTSVFCIICDVYSLFYLPFGSFKHSQKSHKISKI